MREFTACVRTARGTETVTVRANSVELATEKLLRLGYAAVVWIL